MKSVLKTVFIFATILQLSACSQKATESPAYEPNETETGIFSKIQAVSQQAERLWPGYNYPQSLPFYAIVKDPGTSEFHGFLVNPLTPLPDGAVKVNDTPPALPNVYKYDDVLDHSLGALGTDGQFRSRFSINGKFYAVVKTLETDIFYQQYRDVDGNFIPMTITRELFHTFQLNTWTFNDQTRSHADPVEFIWTEEFVSHQLLLSDIMEQSYTAVTQEEMLGYLKAYMSIKSKLLELDQSPDQAMTRLVANQLEHSTGSARYVEHYAAMASIFPTVNDDPTYGWKSYMDRAGTDPSINRGNVKFFLRSHISQHVGAAVIRLLSELEVNVISRMTAGEKPFDMTQDFLGLTVAELRLELEAIKANIDWPAYELRGQQIRNILD